MKRMIKMKSALSLTSIVCLVTSALPVTAQEIRETPAGPLSRAITREAVGLAAAGEPRTSVVGTGSQGGGFEELQKQLKPGDTIFVTDRHGREMSGNLKRLSSTSLVIVNGIDEREILSTEIGRIEKPGDPVWNGALIGFAVGTPFWLIGSGFICAEGNPHGGAGCLVGTSLALGAEWAALGAFIDWLHKGRTLVYSTENRSASPGVNSFAQLWKTGDTVGPVNSFAELWTRIRSGDTVYVIDTNARETTGIFEQVSDSSIALLVNGQLRGIPEAEVRQVARQGDSVWNGALIGAAVGAALGIESAGCDKSKYGSGGCSAGGGERAFLGIFGATAYGAIGLGIDALIKGRTTVYKSSGTASSPRVGVSPLVSARRRGLAVSFTF